MILAAFALVSCGPPAGAESAGAQQTPELTSPSAPASSDPALLEPTVQPVPGPPVPGVPPPAEAPVVRWIPIGPVGPNDPQEGRMYLFAQGRDCEQLRDGVDGTTFKDVWRAAGAVCYALRDGTAAQWQDAATALSAVQAPPEGRCLERAVLAVVRSAVEYHNANPATAVPVEPGTGEACPRKLTGLTVVDENFVPVPGLSRPSGPRAGGSWVRLDGYYVRVSEVKIDGAASGVETRSDGDYSPVYFRTPPAGDKASITVTITDTLDAPGEVQFFYDDTAPTGGPGTPSPSGPESPGSDSPQPSPPPAGNTGTEGP
ncbi:hypothetical protein [Arthrobacter silvisoli]|uniref:hypothetical protein n=1 Tax=Arthrobacter silvisoli TaxID=2291022 RepID=UPI00109BAF12|nr:hypothetical protein [Arthrobacter silvisoli]